MTEKLQAALNSLEQGGFSETSIPAGDLQGSGKWIQAGDFKATEADDAGPLTYKFNGNSIQVSTVKGDDHGVIRVTILDQNEKQICREEIDTYAEKRIEGAELIQKDFPEGSYTI